MIQEGAFISAPLPSKTLMSHSLIKNCLCRALSCWHKSMLHLCRPLNLLVWAFFPLEDMADHSDLASLQIRSVHHEFILEMQGDVVFLSLPMLNSGLAVLVQAAQEIAMCLSLFQRWQCSSNGWKELSAEFAYLFFCLFMKHFGSFWDDRYDINGSHY